MEYQAHEAFYEVAATTIPVLLLALVIEFRQWHIRRDHTRWKRARLVMGLFVGGGLASAMFGFWFALRALTLQETYYFSEVTVYIGLFWLFILVNAAVWMHFQTWLGLRDPKRPEQIE